MIFYIKNKMDCSKGTNPRHWRMETHKFVKSRRTFTRTGYRKDKQRPWRVVVVGGFIILYSSQIQTVSSVMSQHIVALNNTGIQSLEQGFFEQAVRSFYMAIECLTSNTEFQNKKDENHISSHHHSSLTGGDHHQLTVFAVEIAVMNADKVLEISPYNSFDVYQTAFALPQMQSLAAFQTEASIVLFYNLALAHHLWGLSSPDKSQTSLRQAMHIYKLAITALKNKGRLAFHNNCLVLILGVLTNMAHICAHFWCTDQVKACIKRLGLVLQSTNAINELSQQDSEFFFTAMTYGSSQDFCAAPAA